MPRSAILNKTLQGKESPERRVRERERERRRWRTRESLTHEEIYRAMRATVVLKEEVGRTKERKKEGETEGGIERGFTAMVVE